MVNRKEYTKLSVLEDLENRLSKEIDKDNEIYRRFKIGEEIAPEELSYLTLQMEALCSGYCDVDNFIQESLINGKEEESEEEGDRENTFWEDHLRYRKCILTKAFNSETNKCKDLYEWVYRPYPHNM